MTGAAENSLMRIGELAKRASVTQRTVRHYESLGLLPSGERQGSGHHYYNHEALARLQKIDQLKRIGLSLEEIGEVIALYFTDVTGVQAKKKVLEMMRRHLATTEDKIAGLQAFRTDLQGHIERFERFLELGGYL
ncbi:MerR family transcriptional regulator [Deinococcus sp.]|uniref:MerR family transcriptional regulator n=1 Tax=Deinococcus sp. TaxID=47478 RepID=UPI003B5A29AA